MTKAALFAGQGAQAVGMGQDLYSDIDAAAYFGKANTVLGYDIASLCFNGPDEELTRSDHCQPAIFLVSLICYTVFRKRYPQCTFDKLAGLSLGEWTALCVADVLDFDDCLRVLEARGRYMQEACEQNPGSMISVMSLDPDTVAQIAADAGAYIANINSSQQIVVSGTKESIAKAEQLTIAAGGKGIVLNVAGAFHSPLMEPAREKLAKMLIDIPFKAPSIPVFANATGQLHDQDGAVIRDTMLQQVTGTVHWADCVQNSDADAFIEFGPGKVLSSLARRINKQYTVGNMQGAASLEGLAKIAEA